MTHNPVEVMVGGAVLAGAFAFVVYAAQSTGLSQSSGQYELAASFRSSEGINVGTDVRLAGVKVGAVTDVVLNPDTYRADTTFSVEEGVGIPDDSAIIISSEGLLGGNFVEIMPGGSPFNYEPGDEMEDTQGAVSLIQLLVRFVAGTATDEE